jgi:hypothetical protein
MANGSLNGLHRKEVMIDETFISPRGKEVEIRLPVHKWLILFSPN